MGLSAPEILRLSIPELMLALRGWQRARGIDPDGVAKGQAMSRDRMLKLFEKYK